MSQGSLFTFPGFAWISGKSSRVTGTYSAGALFSLGLFFFIDAASYSRSEKNGSEVHVTIVDWISGIFSALGMLIINAIDKSRLNEDSFSYSGEFVAWKARFVLFIGFACMAGGLAGSVTILVLKYIMPGCTFPTLWFGIANILCNALLMTSCATLWISQNLEDEYTYSLAL